MKAIGISSTLSYQMHIKVTLYSETVNKKVIFQLILFVLKQPPNTQYK